MRKHIRRPVFRRLSIGVVGVGIVTAAASGGVATAAPPVPTPVAAPITAPVVQK